MVETELVTIQVPAQYRDMLKVLGKKNRRSMVGEFCTILDREWAKNFSEPNEFITVEQAITAGKGIARAYGDEPSCADTE